MPSGLWLSILIVLPRGASALIGLSPCCCTAWWPCPVGLETAVELHDSLTSSLHVEWLQYQRHGAHLLLEVGSGFFLSFSSFLQCDNSRHLAVACPVRLLGVLKKNGNEPASRCFPSTDCLACRVLYNPSWRCLPNGFHHDVASSPAYDLVLHMDIK